MEPFFILHKITFLSLHICSVSLLSTFIWEQLKYNLLALAFDGETFSVQGSVSQLYKQTLLFLISLTVILTSCCSYFGYHYGVNTGVINNFHYGQGLGSCHSV